ncbi:MAG: FkbM family methyltransferase [Spirulinaceae cyanobacterium]
MNLIFRSGFHYYRMAMVQPPFWVCLQGKCDRVEAENTLGATAIYSEVIVEDREIDFLKMDCEGSEWDILQDESLLQRTRFFCLEYHLSKHQALEDLKVLINQGKHQVTKIEPKPGYQEFGVLWSMRQGE